MLNTKPMLSDYYKSMHYLAETDVNTTFGVVFFGDFTFWKSKIKTLSLEEVVMD